jgi:hypothetical protein
MIVRSPSERQTRGAIAKQKIGTSPTVRVLCIDMSNLRCLEDNSMMNDS